MSKRGPATTLIHHPYQPPEGWAAVPVPVAKASTVLFKDTADLHQPRPRDGLSYRYGLHGTPTSYTLAARLATLEGAQHCLLVPSGLAAVTLTSLALLRPGDEVLVPDNVYGQNRYLTESWLPQWGVTHRFYDPLTVPELRDNTKLVWLEAAGSITLEFPDLLGTLAACRVRGVVTALDNTWGAGLAFNGFEPAPQSHPGLGADIVMQALTKYPSGGADVLMGSVCTRDQALHDRLNYAHEHLGYGLGQNDVELVLRGLPTLPLRYATQDRVTRELAAWMAGQPEVAQVFHPALPGSPGHEFWRQLGDGTGQAGAACLFSVVFKPNYPSSRVDAFVDALQLFGIGYSWAGPMSLAVPYNMSHSRNLGLPFEGHTLVRFAIGLEDGADLRADIEQALSALV
ncbi:MAG: cystathionine beta-lyase [Roseateles depolymerans]|uniref:Cystathionine beta-lyase n=1 Tax=Roseateles depolymerans TaxID=76731 RepID=A0A2W5E528_9BURK|nr:MAG: cystathionine beta-lyase [Roseateles depolymerans]